MFKPYKMDADGKWRKLTNKEICDLVNQAKERPEVIAACHEQAQHAAALCELEETLMEDNKEEFLRQIKSPMLQNDNDKRHIGEYIIYVNAVKCAAAVFDGETNGIIRPDYFECYDGWTPMHQIAGGASKQMLDLFLRKGYSPDLNLRRDWNVFNYKNVLPLNVTLRHFRYLYLSQFWGSCVTVAPRLILEIHTRRATELEFVRSLALNTNETELKDEFFNYANQGKMVEVAVLLLAAGDKLMPGHGQQGIAFNSFKEMRHFLKAKYPWSATNHDDSAEMRETLMLLDIYDKIGNQLTPYALSKRQNGFEIVKLLENNAGVDVSFDCSPYINKNRSTSPSFVPTVSKICAPSDHDKLFYNQSQQPSIPTRQLIHTSSFRKIESKYASSTPAKKLVNVNENLNSCKKLVSFMKLFRRGGRLV